MSRKRVIALLAGMMSVAPATEADIDLYGETLQIYGQFSGSLDLYDRGAVTAAVTKPTGVEITSNSSKLGFKGQKGISGGLIAVWKLESEFDLTGESSTVGVGDRYVGISNDRHRVLVGAHGTPLKFAGSRFGLFGDTVGDYRAILGQVSSGGDNQFNQRAKSMVMYQYDRDAITMTSTYSREFENSSTDSTEPDSGNSGNREILWGLGLVFRRDGLEVAVAYESQANIDNVAGQDARGVRVGAKYKRQKITVGAIVERLSDQGYGPRIARPAHGINLAYASGVYTFGIQYLKAGDSKLIGGDDGADQYTAGVYLDLNKDAQAYLMNARLRNDANAAFQLARSGGGQRYAPSRNGETVNLLSIGLILRL